MRKPKDRAYAAALSQFVREYSANPNVIGILVTGSYVHGRMDPNSDIDVHVVLKESKTRERGNTWIFGIEIEYFVNPVHQILTYFEEEKAEPHTAHMFANGKVVYRNGPQLGRLIATARKIQRARPPRMSKTDRELRRYFLDDLLKDLDDVLQRQDWVAFELISVQLVELCIKILCKHHRIFPDKHKRILPQIAKYSRSFARTVEKAVGQNNRTLRFRTIRDLVRETESLIGGARPKEWRFKSKCSN